MSEEKHRSAYLAMVKRIKMYGYERFQTVFQAV